MIKQIVKNLVELYKWMTKEYENCIYGNKINKELEDEENLSSES